MLALLLLAMASSAKHTFDINDVIAFVVLEAARSEATVWRHDEKAINTEAIAELL